MHYIHYNKLQYILHILPDSELDVVVLNISGRIGFTGFKYFIGSLFEFGQLNFSIISDCF